MKENIRCTAVLMAALTLFTTTAWAAEMEQAIPADAVSAPAEAEQVIPTDAVSAPAEQAVPVPPVPADMGGAPEEVPAEPDWRLLLVNPWNPLPEDFSVELKRLSNGLQVDVRIYEDLENMLVDCRAAGLRPVICSAYRPLATQTRLYNNKVARLLAAGWPSETAPQEAGRWVAIPGTSEHQTGLALDIVASSYQLLNAKQAETAEQRWLMEHCWEYGFILRYPADKTEVTGIGYEPWHYRYVGRETALAIRDSGLCFEEYLESCKTPAKPAEDGLAEQLVPGETSAETIPEVLSGPDTDGGLSSEAPVDASEEALMGVEENHTERNQETAKAVS